MYTSFPSSYAGEEEREPGTHCSRMHQVPLVTWILLRYTKITVNFCLPDERLHCMVILPVGNIWVVLKLKAISLWREQSALFCSRQSINFKGKDFISHMLQRLTGMDKRMLGQFLQTKSWAPSLLPLHSPHNAWSVVGIFNTGRSWRDSRRLV